MFLLVRHARPPLNARYLALSTHHSTKQRACQLHSRAEHAVNPPATTRPLSSQAPSHPAPTADVALSSHSPSTPSSSSSSSSSNSSRSPLSILPLPHLIRSLLITGVSSYPLLLRPAMFILSYLAHSQSPLLNPDRNPVLHYLLKKTFYAQFCAGEAHGEIRRTVAGLKDLGYAGVILSYAKEVVVENDRSTTEEEKGATASAAESDREVQFWKDATLETIRLTGEGGFVAVKFTGAGQKAVDHLLKAIPPQPVLERAIVEICDLAAKQNVPLLFDAEQQAVQAGIDAWTLDFQRRYNKRTPGQAVVYGTYQAYLKATPRILAEHLAAAQRDGFTLGVKLVRGAYLWSDPRHLIWTHKEETDRTYDGIAESLIKNRYGGVLQPLPDHKDEGLPEVNLVLATHNHESVRKAHIHRKQQIQNGQKRIAMVYSQLLGMADELSCELLHEGKEPPTTAGKENSVSASVDAPKVLKYVVWGSVGECMKYLLRRAEENRDAMGRTRESCRALNAELGRRIRASLRGS